MVPEYIHRVLTIAMTGKLPNMDNEMLVESFDINQYYYVLRRRIIIIFENDCIRIKWFWL